ncbi:MAG: hypothetical protein ACRCZW_13210 [Lactobacillaceae bacterium]
MLSLKDFLSLIEIWGNVKKGHDIAAVEKLKIIKEFEKKANMVAKVINLQDSELMAGKYKEYQKAGEEILDALDIMINNKPFSLEQQEIFKNLVYSSNSYAMYAETYAINPNSENIKLLDRLNSSFKDVEDFYHEAIEIIEELRLKFKK